MLTIPFTTICAGETMTLTASAGGAASYSINGTDWYASNVFEVAPTSTTHYTLYAQTAEGCVASEASAAVVTIYPAVSPGEITTASTTVDIIGTNPNVTIANLDDATGGSGNITYEWRRSGTSSAILTGTNATYTLSSDAAGNYWASGSYYFNRYAKDATCNTPWVAAMGTYTLYVEASTITFCEECCWDGDAVNISAGTWVNCHVTTNAYPFDNTSTNIYVVWSGNGATFYSGASGSGSDKNGRANTAVISSSTITVNAVQVCEDLGTGWYLPAYEELVNMSKANSSSTYPPLNGLSGAGILMGTWHWSSTEYYDNSGRYPYTTPIYNVEDHKKTIPFINFNGEQAVGNKLIGGHFCCAWRP
jgi:hypothetical protein